MVKIEVFFDLEKGEIIWKDKGDNCEFWNSLVNGKYLRNYSEN